MQKTFIEKCVAALQKEDVLLEIKSWFKPVAAIVLREIYPYIYLVAVFIIMTFFLQLATFSLLLRVHRNYYSLTKT